MTNNVSINENQTMIVNANNNNNNNDNNNDNGNNNEQQLSLTVFAAYRDLAAKHGIVDYSLEAHNIAGVGIGDNAFGVVLRVTITPRSDDDHHHRRQTPFRSIVKMAPKNQARRAHMRVPDYYRREVFMYDKIFKAYRELSTTSDTGNHTFDIVPELLHWSLIEGDEFLIFEDLTERSFRQNSRSNRLSYDLVEKALIALGELHAMSFVLQSRQPQKFQELIDQLDDNLFTDDMDKLTIEFGKKYVQRTRQMIEENEGDDEIDANDDKRQLLNILTDINENFKSICLQLVNGSACSPYAVICHGDFWNNNILYGYDSDNDHLPSTAKLIDFQISRYASPVLDLGHYIFVCTEPELRREHFKQFLDVYYNAVCKNLHLYGLDENDIYPRRVFDEQLHAYGVYGFCMAAFAIPFFISMGNEVPDLDEVSEAIRELPSAVQKSSGIVGEQETAASDDGDSTAIVTADVERQCREFVDEHDLLTERTVPIFRRRMIAIIADLKRYDMLGQERLQ